VAFHPREPRLAVSPWWTSTLQILDLVGGRVLRTLEHRVEIKGFAWHPDGDYLAVGCADNTVRVWEASTGKPLTVLEGHQNTVMEVAFSHGGDLLASRGWDGTTRLWDPIGGKELVSIPGHFIRFGPDDRQLAFAQDAEVGLWEVATGRECRTFRAAAEKGTGPWRPPVGPGHRPGTRSPAGGEKPRGAL